MSTRGWVHGWLLRAVLAGACLAVWGCSRTPVEPQARDARDEVARLQRSTAVLERQVELATGKDFYLVLDPAVPDLALMLRGADLQRYPVLGMTVGEPRMAWMRRAGGQSWQGVIWSGGTLDPARPVHRVVLQEPESGPADAEPSPPPVPPTAEERYRVPSRYRIRFADGLSVEIRPREGDTTAGAWVRLRTWWSAKWRDVFAVVRARHRDALRLRIVLSPRDAESLYRALPPDVRLLVLPGGQR